MSRAHGDLEVQFLRKEMLKIRQEIAIRPIGAPMRGSSTTDALIQIIGGQVINSVPIIQYLADPLTPTQFYDPDIDTSYQIGLGYGWLYSAFGRPRARVLVRHNFIANVDPIIGGDCYRTTGTQALVYSGQNMIAYEITYG